MAEEEAREGAETALYVYRHPLALFSYFKYIGMILSAPYDDCPEVVRNIRQVWKKWARMTRFLDRYGADARTSGDVLHCGGTRSESIWVGDVGCVSAHWEYLGQIPPQGVQHTYRTAIVEGAVWDVCVPYTGGGDDRGGPAGGGDLHSSLPEHILTVNLYQAHYRPVSGGGATPRYKGV